jgi:hypothetical protein
MNRAIAFLIGTVMILAVAGPVLAADPVVPAEGQVIVVIDGNAALPADQHAAAVVVIQGDATIDGTANNVTVVGGTATISGTVQTLTIVEGRAELLAPARIAGDILELNSTVARADGATVGGTVRSLATDLVGLALFLGFAALLVWVGVAIAMLLAGILLAGFAARQVRTAEAVISSEPLKAFLVGLAMLIVPPIAVVLLAVTIVGLPLALSLLFLVWPALAFVGYLVGAIWIGEWLLVRTGRPAGERPYLGAVVGLVVAGVLGIVPLVSAVISIFGLGAVTVAGWRTLFQRPVAYGQPQQPQPQPQPAAV